MVLVNTPKRTVPMHHKKRLGHHHKQTRRYEKPYSPYLPMLLIVVFGLALSGLWSWQQRAVLGYSINASATGLLADTNLARSTNGEPGLSLNANLAAAAQAKAQDMVAHNYWSHVSPSGEQPWQFIAQTGYGYETAGENLAYGFGSNSATIAAWMNSTEHRANILNAAFTNVGFGIANASDFLGRGPATVVVAMYAEPTSGSSAASNNQHTTVLGARSPATVSRIQMLTGGYAPWSFGVVAILAFAAGVITAIRHGLLWRKAWARGEAFVAHHHVLDIVLVSVGVAGFILTRAAAGAIH